MIAPSKLGLTVLTLWVSVAWISCSGTPTAPPAAPATPTAAVSEASPVEPADAVAVVNGEPITEVELDRELDRLLNDRSAVPRGATSTNLLRADMRRKALDNVINLKVQILEARKQNIPVTEEELDQFYTRLEKAFASPEEHKKVIASLGYTPQEYRRGLADDLRVKKLRDQWVAAHPVELADQEVAEFYQTRLKLGQLKSSDGTRDMALEEFKEKIRPSMVEYKQQKDYEKYVSELRAAAQVVENKP